MAKPKSKPEEPKAKPEEPKVAETAERVTRQDMTKADAVRAAIMAGKDMPAEGVAWIMDEFGIEVTPGAFSSYKTTDKNKAAPAVSPKSAVTLVPASNGKSSGQKAGDFIALAQQVKALVDAHGVAAVKGMADVFGK